MQIGKVNFTGYKNVIGYCSDNKQQKFDVISMQLTNEGHKDLEKWTKIQSQLLPSNEPSDTFVLVRFEDKNQNINTFNLNGRALCINDEAHCITAQEEAPMLKFYAMLKSINEKLMNGADWQKDDEVLETVIPELLKTFEALDFSPELSMNVLSQAMTNANKIIPPTAKSINDNIENCVDGYFKNI